MSQSGRGTKKIKILARSRLAPYGPKGAKARARSSRRGNWRRGASRKRWVEAGSAAVKRWQEESVQEGLRAFEIDEAPSELLDQAHPWWAFINDARRPRSERLVLMGLAPRGAPAPNWESMAKDVSASLTAKRTAEGVVVRRNPERAATVRVSAVVQPLRSRWGPIAKAGGAAWLGSERAASWSVTNILSGVFSDKGWMRAAQTINPRDGARFDKRRAAKRQGRQAPSRWIEKFGELGQAIWESGAGKGRLAIKKNYGYEGKVEAISRAMLSAGALRVQLCPSFLERNFQAMKSWAGFVEMDEQCSDALRAGWAIDAAAGAPKKSGQRRARI